jgi:hypothetical protein
MAFVQQLDPFAHLVRTHPHLVCRQLLPKLTRFWDGDPLSHLRLATEFEVPDLLLEPLVQKTVLVKRLVPTVPNQVGDYVSACIKVVVPKVRLLLEKLKRNLRECVKCHVFLSFFVSFLVLISHIPGPLSLSRRFTGGRAPLVPPGCSRPVRVFALKKMACKPLKTTQQCSPT